MKRILALLLALSLLCVPALGDETGGMLEKAEAFVDFSDIGNVREVTEHSVPGDLNLRMRSDGSYVKE